MNWYRVSFSREAVVSGALIQLQEEFHQAFMDAGKPSLAALFSQLKPAPSEFIVDVFFTPVAEGIMAGWVASAQGVACEPPSDPAIRTSEAGPFALIYLVGDLRAWSLIQPEHSEGRRPIK